MTLVFIQCIVNALFATAGAWQNVLYKWQSISTLTFIVVLSTVDCTVVAWNLWMTLLKHANSLSYYSYPILKICFNIEHLLV
jgi:hypothetical protein